MYKEREREGGGGGSAILVNLGQAYTKAEQWQHCLLFRHKFTPLIDLYGEIS